MLQSCLLSHFQQVNEALSSSNIDVGSLARNFGAGVITNVNTVVGIPMLVASLFSDYQKNKGKKYLKSGR